MHFFTRNLCFYVLLCVAVLRAQDTTRVSVVAIPNTAQEFASPDTVRFYDRSFALVVGMSAYSEGWRPLAHAASDADEVARVLETRGFEVQLVKDLTSKELVSEMKAFFYAKTARDHSRLLFYFAGHGHTVNGFSGPLGYIVPIDAPLPIAGALGDFQQSAISMDILKSYAEATGAKHVLFVFDSCFSGVILQSFRALTEGIAYSLGQKVRQMITAGGVNEQVPDISIFKEHFIKGIQGAADLYKDNYVTGAELGYYLRQEVARLSVGQQNPMEGILRTSGSENGDFVFRVTQATKDSSDTKFLDWKQRRAQVYRSQPKIKFGLLEITSPYYGDFYVDGKLVRRNANYYKSVLLPDTYNIMILGNQGYYYKKTIVIQDDGETTTVRPEKIFSGF